MRTRLASPLLSLFALLSACGAEPGSASGALTPEETVAAFLDAIRADDQARFEELLTPAAAEALRSGDGLSLQGDELGAIVLGDAILEGERAEVPVTATVDGEEQRIRLVLRQEDAWRVSGMVLVLGEGAEFSVDFEVMDELVAGIGEELAAGFEEAFTEMSLGGSPADIAEARARFDAIAGLSREAHESAWKVDLFSGDRPALEVLEELVAGTGLGIDPGAHGERLSGPVSVSEYGVSRLEAIERVTSAAGLHPVYPELAMLWGEDAERPKIAFEAGKRRQPIAHAGPFLIEVSELDETPPHGTGSITVAVRALGLAPEVLAFQTEMVELLSVNTIVDAQGGNVNGDDGVSFFGTPAVQGGYLTDNTSLDLRGLLRAVQSVSLSGRLHLEVPTTVVAERWKRGDQRERSLAGLTASLESWGESTRIRMGGMEDVLEHTQVRLSPLNAADEPLGVLMSSSQAWGEELWADVQTPEPPAAVDLKLCTVESLEYAFELSDVPLARSAEQPERLEPLRFEGDVPLAIEFVRFTKRDADFPEVELSLHNRANKDAADATVTLVYLGASGNELGDSFQTLSGTWGMDGMQPLAPAGAKSSQETVAFFMPEGTRNIRVRLEGATFADASEWEADD